MSEFEIHWLSQQEPQSGRVTIVEVDDFAAAMWEATRLLRARITSNRAEVEIGLIGNGFQVFPCANEVSDSVSNV